MKDKILIAGITQEAVIGIIIFAILLITSLVVSIKTRKSTRKKIKVIHVISIIILLTLLTALFPGAFAIGLLILLFKIIKSMPDKDNYSSTYYSTYNYTHDSNDSGNNYYKHENQEIEASKSYEKHYCHYGDYKVSTIYGDDTVIRSDGVCGFKDGNLIHYNDGSTCHIIELDNKTNIIDRL